VELGADQRADSREEAGVPGVIAAATGSDWSAGGSILTFYFPVGLFVVVAGTLYLLFSRPHRRVPARRGLAAAHATGATPQRVRPSSAGGTPAAKPSQDVPGDGCGGDLQPEGSATDAGMEDDE
jgi:hypothetical protein